MLGAIIGDIVGSRFEWDNHRHKEFELFHPSCFFTDDSIMTLAIAKAILHTEYLEQLSDNVVRCMQELGRRYPDGGYGARFAGWLLEKIPNPIIALETVPPCV